MAVLGRLLISSAERLDLPDFLSIDSYTQGDFKYLMKSFIGSDRPYVLTGFDIINPGSAIGTQNVSIRVADSVVYYPGSPAGPFFHGLEEGNTLAAPLVPELRKNSTNYIYITLTTAEAAKDTRAFWDPDKEGGVGGEFTQDINTQTALVAAVNVSTSSFPENTVPVAIVEVGPNFITSIEDARDMMFRLGTGGLNPDPSSSYAFRDLPGSSNSRLEPNTIMTNALDPNSFQGGDKNIQTLKEWMDVVMTKLKELGGTTYWYEDTSTFTTINIFKDALATSIKSKGLWQSSDATPGLLTWTEDILVQSVSDSKDRIIRAGNKVLDNDQTMYIQFVRRDDINTGSVSVDWLNSLNYVNGTLGSFENLSKGDWVKKLDDPDYRFLRVEEFYAAANLGGGVTAPGNALSIKLSDVYGGISESKRGVYNKGVYLSSEVQVADRNDPALTDLGGDLYWLAMRSDTIMSVSDLTTTTLSIDISNHDGLTAKVTSVAHGLSDGQRIGISGTTNFDGTYAVEVEDVDTFYIDIAGGPFADEAGQSAYYTTVTTQIRSTVDGLQLESANHGFNTDQTIQLSDTTNYNGSYKVFSTGNTTFTIPVSSAIANETTGTATAVTVYIRTDVGPTKLDQGENKQIGKTDTENLMSFIGMDNATQTYPSYHIPPDYNTLDGMQNYNGEVTDNLTQRVSKLTAMMADKAQDKTIVFAPSGYITVNNVLNGTARDISFNPAPSETPRLDIILPSSDQNNSITLNGVISLEQYEAAYIQIDRNNPQDLANLTFVSVAPITSIPLEENTVILAVRLGTGEVWLWDGFYVSGGITPIPSFISSVVQQNANLKLVKGGLWSWDLINNNLTLSADAYIHINGLLETRNTIQAQTINLPNDGDVAYVDVNRSGVGVSNLTVTVAAQSSLVDDLDRFVIARRINDSVIVGTNSMALYHDDSKAIDADYKLAKVRIIDIVNSTLPAGVSATIDGLAVANGDKVLFVHPSLNGIYTVDGVGVSLSWTKLDSFGGNTNPEEGDMVAVQEGSAHFNTIWVFLGGAWLPQTYNEIQKEPTGWPNQTDSTISFDDGTRTFSITPVGTHFDYYIKGKVYRKTTTQSVVIPDVEGMYLFNFNGDTLTYQTGFTLDLITDRAYVATVYWDATNGEAVHVGEERHGLIMDGTTHSYLHNTFGVRWSSGLSAGNFTIAGDGTADADAELSISDGTIWDEDIRINIFDGAGSSRFEQELDPIAQIPVYYRDGANGYWRKETANNFPIKLSAGAPPASQIANTTGLGSGVAADLDTFYLAQTFTTSGAFNVGSVDVSISNNAGTGNAQLEIWGMSGGQPDHTNVIATSTNVIDQSTLTSSYSTETFNFSGEALSAATQYALVLKHDGGATTGNTSWQQTSVSYGGGTYQYANNPGTNGTWTNNPGTDLFFEIFDNGTAGGGPLYNNPAGPWTQDAVTDTYHFAMWIFATNEIDEPIVAIMGQREDDTLSNAQTNNTYDSLSFGDLPSQEMKVLYRLIFEYDSSYSNSVSSALRDIIDLRQVIDTSVGAYSASDHQLLSNRNAPNAHNATAISQDTSAFVGLESTDNTVQASIDALDKFFGQLRLREHPSNKKRVILTGANQALNNGSTLIQTIKNLLIKFEGAEIDFDTGNIYESDGTTSLGIDFTPATIAAGQYHWYSVTAVASSINIDQSISLQLVVLSGAGDGATPDLAPKAPFARDGLQIGKVYVQEDSGSIVDIVTTNIRQLGTSGGSGGGEGDRGEFDFNNNQSTPALIPDLNFDSSDNKAFKVEYSIERFHQDAGGTEDVAFNTNLGTGFTWGFNDSIVLAMREQLDGKILIAGEYDSFNSNTRNGLVRLNSDGTEDTAFYTNLGTGFSQPGIYGLAIQPDGKILVGGFFNSFNSNTRNGLVRLNSDGTEDTAFYTNLGTGFSGPTNPGAFEILVKSDNKILAGGRFDDFNTTTFNALVSLNVDFTEERMTQGSFSGLYRASVGDWELGGFTSMGDASGVIFSIDSNGQVYYVSDDITSTLVESKLKYVITRL